MESQKPYIWFTLAIALLRDGQHDEALATLEQFSWGRGEATTNRSRYWLNSTYLRPMLLQALNRPDEAAADFAVAEQYYRQFCRETLERPSGPFPGPVNMQWWWLVYPQQLRRETWRKLHGGKPPDDPWQHLIQARGYHLIGETEKAQQELAAATAAAADDPDVLVARLHLLEQWGQFELDDWHEADWQRFVDLAGDNPESWRYRARWYAEQGGYDRAADDFDRAIGLTPAPERLEQMHRRVPRRRCHWSAMRWNEVYERLARLRDDDAFLAYDRVLFLTARSEFGAALQAFGNVETEHWTHPVWAQYGMLCLLEGDRDGYLAACRELERRYHSKQNWSNAELRRWAETATVVPESGIDPEILRTVSRRLWGDGDCDADFARGAGFCSLRAGDYALALVQMRRAPGGLRFFPLAIVNHHLGNAEQSREWYDKGVAVLGKFQSQMTDPESELNRFHWLMMNVFHREATDLLESSPDYWMSRARPQLDAGEFDAAVENLARAVPLSPPSPGHWYRYTLARLAADGPDGYRAACTELMSQLSDSTDPDAAVTIVWCCALAPDSGVDPRQVIERAQQVLDTAPDAAVHLYKLGAAHYRAGNYEQAVQWLDRAVAARKGGGCTWDWLFLAMSHRRLGNPDESMRFYSQAAESFREDAAQLDWAARFDLQQLLDEAETLIGVDAES